MSQMKSPCEGCTRECPAAGCKEWAEWFTQNWNQNIHHQVPPVPKQVWQYEHPDRVREIAQEVGNGK